MATIINTTPQVQQPQEERSSGLAISLVVIVLVLLLLVAFGLPLIRGAYTNRSSAPEINVPSQVDVNIKKY